MNPNERADGGIYNTCTIAKRREQHETLAKIENHLSIQRSLVIVFHFSRHMEEKLTS